MSQLYHRPSMSYKPKYRCTFLTFIQLSHVTGSQKVVFTGKYCHLLARCVTVDILYRIFYSVFGQ